MGASLSIFKSTIPLNPMTFHPRFPHISEKVFEKLDKESLKSCRKVSKSWQNCIEIENSLWKKIIKDLEEENIVLLFLKACAHGQPQLAKMLIQKAANLNIDLNQRPKYWNQG